MTPVLDSALFPCLRGMAPDALGMHCNATLTSLPHHPPHHMLRLATSQAFLGLGRIPTGGGSRLADLRPASAVLAGLRPVWFSQSPRFKRVSSANTNAAPPSAQATAALGMPAAADGPGWVASQFDWIRPEVRQQLKGLLAAPIYTGTVLAGVAACDFAARGFLNQLP